MGDSNRVGVRSLVVGTKRKRKSVRGGSFSLLPSTSFSFCFFFLILLLGLLPILYFSSCSSFVAASFSSPPPHASFTVFTGSC